MRKLAFGFILIWYMFACQDAVEKEKEIKIDEELQLVQLSDSIFIHISWHQTKTYGNVPSNGLIIIKNGKAIMVDTPMDNEKTMRLVNYLEDSLKVKIVKQIPGHFHDDCIGGLSYLKSIGVSSLANFLTIEKCMNLGLPVPGESFSDSVYIDFFGEQIECRYLGGGHSSDNVVLWLPARKILFGGCLVKSLSSQDLGNTADALVDDWDQTIKKIKARYPEIKTVVPGHGQHGGTELLDHTIKLVEAHRLR
jgi:metallo-beta-lactamase class B